VKLLALLNTRSSLPLEIQHTLQMPWRSHTSRRYATDVTMCCEAACKQAIKKAGTRRGRNERIPAGSG
jgi:hypothetical protein